MCSTKRFVSFLSTALLAAIPAQASLKVDVNGDTKGRKDVLTPRVENWVVPDGESATQSFGPITVTLRGANGGLKGMWWKAGLDADATLSSDGVAARQLQMNISGLSPGKHTIVTYHSGTEPTVPGPFDIAVDGKPAVRGASATNRVADDYDTGSATVQVEASAGKDVVLLFKPQRSNDAVILNGFEIDTADPKKRAIKPSPKDADEHAPEKTVLSWAAAKGAKQHHVYLGTDAQAVAGADNSSPLFKGTVEQPSYETSGLNTFDTYYWRVDEVAGDDTVTKGDVWSFRVRHLAFPGAEGYGRFARGGRGGKVYEVTTLDDSGPGSFREAVEAEGPRTVVFRVGGTIHLKHRLGIKNPYITIAGQTAPGEGIALRGFGFGAGGTHDVIVRYLRIRVGDESGLTQDGSGFGNCDHCIMDHCSIAWSIDEAFSSRLAKNITLQRSIIAEPLNQSIHSHYVGTGKGHGFAGSISGEIGSFHHNLIANAAGRNWSLAGGFNKGMTGFAGYLDIRNNVCYNWNHRTTDGGVRRCNFVGNYYIPGPATQVFHFVISTIEHALPSDVQMNYVAGNVMEGRPQYDADNWANGGVIGNNLREMKLDKPFCESFITEQSAKDAYESVMADVGASWPKYDAIDARTVKDVTNRTTSYKGSKTGMPGIPDSQTDVGPYPDLKGGDAPADSDHDGMPDEWEKANGLNPNDPSDGNKDGVGDGYTNLERYLNAIVAPKH